MNLMNPFDWMFGTSPTPDSDRKDVCHLPDWSWLNIHYYLPKSLEVQPEATFEELIKWFAEQPSRPEVTKGAILRRPHPRGEVIIQLFLDKNNEVVRDSDGQPSGRKFVVKALDEELCEAFGNKNIIIVE